MTDNNYLAKDRNIISHKDLDDESKIVQFFTDNGADYFNCGQGYYEDEVEVLLQIGDTFYNVQIIADIESARQDRGDRLYWVEDIYDVRYQVVDIPSPKPRKNTGVTLLNITEDELFKVKAYFGENKIDFIIQEDV